jgi:hypothetical protein
MKNFKFIFFGALFGLILTKTEAVSWYRIQEMFHFQSFHMYGIIGSAVVVGMISVFIIKRLQMKSVNGETIDFPDKTFNKGSVIGGTIFGMGWALAGACPGPMYALAGAGYPGILLAIASALFGTWLYSYLRPKLPH